MNRRKVLRTILYIVGAIYTFVMLAVGRFFSYHDMFIPRSRPSSAALKDYDYEDVEFTNLEGMTLRGWFIKSKNNPSNQTVFMIAGFTRTRLRILPQIKFFLDSGFHVFTYDQRSHGASDVGLITYGPQEGLDLLAGVKYAKTKLDVNINKMIAVGFSYGTTAIIYAIANSDKPIFKAVILEGVFAGSRDFAEHFLTKTGGYLGVFFGYAFMELGAQIWSLGKYRHSRAIEHIGKISPTPVMIIRGENDHLISEISAKSMMEAAKEPKKYWIHTMGGHTQSYPTYPEEYKKRVLGFLNTYL